jgi:2'-5' RNA ligase
MAAVAEAPGLGASRARLAGAFAPWLTPQDRQPFRPHVTIMNKADRTSAARAFAELGAAWVAWEGRGESLLLWRYRGGPWEGVGEFALRGGTTG